jgi:hypothetical protein
MCLNQGSNCTNPLVAKEGATMPKGLEEILGCQIKGKASSMAPKLFDMGFCHRGIQGVT